MMITNSWREETHGYKLKEAECILFLSTWLNIPEEYSKAKTEIITYSLMIRNALEEIQSKGKEKKNQKKEITIIQEYFPPPLFKKNGKRKSEDLQQFDIVSLCSC